MEGREGKSFQPLERLNDFKYQPKECEIYPYGMVNHQLFFRNGVTF